MHDTVFVAIGLVAGGASAVMAQGMFQPFENWGRVALAAFWWAVAIGAALLSYTLLRAGGL